MSPGANKDGGKKAAWFCPHCPARPGGDPHKQPYRNMPHRTDCNMCHRSKGQCLQGQRQPQPPTHAAKQAQQQRADDWSKKGRGSQPDQAVDASSKRERVLEKQVAELTRKVAGLAKSPGRDTDPAAAVVVEDGDDDTMDGPAPATDHPVETLRVMRQPLIDLGIGEGNAEYDGFTMRIAAATAAMEAALPGPTRLKKVDHAIRITSEKAASIKARKAKTKAQLLLLDAEEEKADAAAAAAKAEKEDLLAELAETDRKSGGRGGTVPFANLAPFSFGVGGIGDLAACYSDAYLAQCGMVVGTEFRSMVTTLHEFCSKMQAMAPGWAAIQAAELRAREEAATATTAAAQLAATQLAASRVVPAPAAPVLLGGNPGETGSGGGLPAQIAEVVLDPGADGDTQLDDDGHSGIDEFFALLAAGGDGVTKVPDEQLKAMSEAYGAITYKRGGSRSGPFSG